MLCPSRTNLFVFLLFGQNCIFLYYATGLVTPLTLRRHRVKRTLVPGDKGSLPTFDKKKTLGARDEREIEFSRKQLNNSLQIL